MGPDLFDAHLRAICVPFALHLAGLGISCRYICVQSSLRCDTSLLQGIFCALMLPKSVVLTCQCSSACSRYRILWPIMVPRRTADSELCDTCLVIYPIQQLLYHYLWQLPGDDWPGPPYLRHPDESQKLRAESSLFGADVVFRISAPSQQMRCLFISQRHRSMNVRTRSFVRREASVKFGPSRIRTLALSAPLPRACGGANACAAATAATATYSENVYSPGTPD